jgi:uncharacterized protein (TIGR02594 family)
VKTEPKWLELARSYVGEREIHGLKHNSKIVQWFADIRTSFRDDETPWCAAFVGAMLERSGIRSTRSAAARSYLNWGVSLPFPVPGCIVVYSRPGSSWSGHVGFPVAVDQRGDIMTLGGNQGDMVSIKLFDKARVLSYRWPSDQLIDLRVQLPIIVSDGKLSTQEA